MSQEIGPVTVCHGMSLVITLTKDCASPLLWAQKHVMDFKVKDLEFNETCNKTTKLYRSDYMGDILCHVPTLKDYVITIQSAYKDEKPLSTSLQL